MPEGEVRGMEYLSVPCGSIMGIPIRLHVFLPLVALLAGISTMLAGHPWQSVILAVVVAGPLLLITVLLHELGHVWAAKRVGCSADHILLWPLGGLAFIGGSVKPKEQIFISGSGPATHVPMLGLWAAVLALLHGSVTLSTQGLWIDQDFGSLVCIAMLNTNLAMLLFNLLVPCFPLDCSRILASLLLLQGMEPSTAAKVIVACSVLALLAVLAISAWSVISHHSSSSLNLLVAIWLGAQTWRLHQARVHGQLASDPLFAAAMAGQAANTGSGQTIGSAGAAASRGNSREPLPEFPGGAHSYGKAGTSAQRSGGLGRHFSLGHCPLGRKGRSQPE
ncbi:Zinc metalloprotease MJ0392 (MjS2P) (S2P endopeptidase) (Site-2-type intramembrane protease) [Durusdinium trenchii]|uniref:Zinc metalloprotease MJ0392 (MjS2P) (S2P endopeptidase) (Site-2-type intramembrane protease) n=1 Tax=Durusdinium trenchii TaxID=1381693 RepID=A0ABP0RZM6_9DINO